MRKTALLIVLVVMASLWTTLARAQTVRDDSGLNIEISPARLILQGAPGKTIDASISIRNRNANTEQLKLEVLKVRVNQDRLELVVPDSSDDFPRWVKFGRPLPIEAPPDQIQSVPIKIDIPKTAAFAYDYAILISRSQAVRAPPGSTQAVEGKVAQFVLLDVVAPGAKRAAEIVALRTSRPWYTFLPAETYLTVRNVGNLHVVPTGNLFIQSMAGRQLAALEVNKDKGTILPGMQRLFGNQWNDGFPHYETRDGRRRLVWNWADLTRIRIGRYRAEAVLVYNDGQRDVPMTAATSFWVIPWPLLLILLILVLLLLTGIVRLFKSATRLARRGDKNKPS